LVRVPEGQGKRAREIIWDRVSLRGRIFILDRNYIEGVIGGGMEFEKEIGLTSHIRMISVEGLRLSMDFGGKNL
jgi:hypothetical protein